MLALKILGERFKGFARQSQCRADSKLVSEAFQGHLKVVMKDRSMCARWRLMARNYACSDLGGAEDATTWLNMFVDGMDMAKFGIPRNISKAKAFEALTKPETLLRLKVLQTSQHKNLDRPSCSPGGEVFGGCDRRNCRDILSHGSHSGFYIQFGYDTLD